MMMDDEVTANGDVSGWLAEIVAELRDEFGGDLPIEVALKKLPATPSTREVRELIESARDHPRNYMILRLFYYTGVRVSELAHLCFADVSYDAGTVFVRSGKEDRDRYVFLDEHTLELVRRWQGERPPSDSVVGIRQRDLAALVTKYGKKVGLVQKYAAMGRGFSPHSLRHAFATHRYDMGMDLYVLMKLLGHQYVSTTLIYVQASMRHIRKAYRKTDPLKGR